MRKNKLTRIAALFLSAAMTFTALPAAAASPGNDSSAVAAQSSIEIVNKVTVSDASAVVGATTNEPTASPTATITNNNDANTSTVATTESAVAATAFGLTRDTTSTNGYGTAGFGTKPPDGNGIQLGDKFDIGGHAYIENDYQNVAVIAQDATYQSGTMWSKDKLDLNQSFETEMYMYLSKKYNGSPTAAVADGMTFVLHNDSRGNGAIGGAGGSIGAYGGIQNSMIVEFDTYYNSGADSSFTQNIEGHVAAFMFSNGHLPSVDEHNAAGATKFKLRSVKSADPALQNEWILFTAKWVPDGRGNGSLSIHFGNPEDPAENVYDKTFNVTDYVQYFGSNEVYWGFTGATGGASAIHAAAITKLPDQKLGAEKKVFKDNVEIIGGAASVGDILTYQLTSSTFEEADPESIAAVIMEDALPYGVEYIAGSAKKFDWTDAPPVSIEPVINGNTLIFDTDVKLQAANSFVTVTFDVQVTDDAYGQTLTNTALIYSEKTIADKAATNPVAVVVNADYIVKYYYEDDNGDFIYDSEQDQLVSNIPVGTIVNEYQSKPLPGYQLDESQTNSSLTITQDQESNVFNVYYQYQTMTVKYATTGNGSVNRVSDNVRYGKTVEQLPTPTPDDGYVFAGWSFENEEQLYTSEELQAMPVENNLSLYAKFRKADAPTIEETGRSQTAWTNQDVTVDYVVKSETDALANVQEDGANISGLETGSQEYKGQLTFTENGTQTIDAASVLNLAADSFPIKVTNIDKLAPKIQDKLDKEQGNVSAKDILSSIAFLDTDESGSISGGNVSGINEDTKTLYLYQKNDSGIYVLEETILFKDLESKLKNISAGQYYYAVSVKDNANNYTDTSGKTSSNPPTVADPTLEGPTGGPIYINVKEPMILPTLTTEDGKPYKTATWTNQDVNVNYNVDGGGVKVTEVNEDGNKVITLVPDNQYDGKFVVTEEGQTRHEIDAKNEADLKGNSLLDIWIDKTNPVIESPNTGKKIEEVIKDLTYDDEASGIETGSDKIKVIDKNTGDIVLEGTKDEVLKKIEDGELKDGEYKIEVTVKDNAGNESDPKTVDDLYYVKGNSAVTVAISYNPDNVWTNDDVTATYTITSSLAIEKVLVDGKEVVLDKTGTITFDANTEKTITVVTAAGEETFTATVSWIDKEAPSVKDLPKGDAQGVLTADDIKADVQFDDTGSANGSFEGAKESGINSKTKKVYFYQNGELIKEANWEDLETTMNDLPSGKYTYVVSVEDNAGNYGDSNGKTVAGANDKTSKKPDGPGLDSPEVFINPVDPSIQTTLTNKDGSKYIQGTWTNQDVTVKYDVDGNGINLSNVELDGTKKLTSDKPSYTGNFAQKTEGQNSYNIKGENEIGTIVTDTVQIWIDTTPPKAKLPAAGKTIDENVFKDGVIALEDLGEGSGIDEEETIFTITPYENGKLGEPITATASGSMKDWSCDGLFKEGVTYKITLTGKDKAGNTVTETVDKVLYMADPAAAAKNDKVDAWVKGIDGNIQQVNVESKDYPIQSITVNVDGKVVNTITPATGTKETEFLVTANAKQKVIITIKLTCTSEVTLTYTPPNYQTSYCTGSYESEKHPTGQTSTPTEGLMIAGGTLISPPSEYSTASFQADIEAISFVNNESSATGATITKYWAQRNKVGAYTAYTPTTIATVYRLTPNIAYNIILEVSYDGKTYYFDGSSATGQTTKPTTGGYVVKG